jgi:anaerobic magnesium-protoporphyrin IX monomethyl ester cyclase
LSTILLITSAKKPTRWSYWSYPPLGLGYIASYLIKYHGADRVKIVERPFEYDIKKLIKKYKPDIVGISNTTQEYNTACKLAEEIKKIDKNILVVTGGHHISALPKTLSKDIDIGVIGEGEETFTEIVKAHEKGDISELDKIKGIVYWKNNQLSMTEKRRLIQPLDKIPFPARNLMKIGNYTHMLSSRGCPYHCIYCSSSKFWSSCRFHSPEYVVEEIKEIIYKFGVRSIHFTDDLFIAQKKRVEQISKLIKDEKINEIVEFHCLVRSNLLDEEIIKHLKKMNIVALSMGFETGCESVLSRIKRNTVTVQQNRDALKLARKYNMRVDGLFMIGAPNEAKDQMIETLRFIKENQLTSAQINVMIPYPGTDIWEYAKSRNLVSEEMDWDYLDMDFVGNNEKFIVIDNALSRQELNEMYFKIKNATGQKKSLSERSKDQILQAFHSGVLPATTRAIHSLNTPDALLASGYKILKKFGLTRVI